MSELNIKVVLNLIGFVSFMAILLFCQYCYQSRGAIASDLEESLAESNGTVHPEGESRERHVTEV